MPDDVPEPEKTRRIVELQVARLGRTLQDRRLELAVTDAAKAPKGTIRGEFGTDVERNAAHGSDAPETARAEIAFFFPGLELPGATATP